MTCPLIEYMEYRRFLRTSMAFVKEPLSYVQFLQLSQAPEGYWTLTEAEEADLEQRKQT